MPKNLTNQSELAGGPKNCTTQSTNCYEASHLNCGRYVYLAGGDNQTVQQVGG